jgi:hypothetical protein|tara:strand:- start:551 stop:1033 length:483 start_codon:yes stop_codon:yes gene_type:complete
MEYQEVIISNVHTRGFAFGVCKYTGEQVFIPPFVALLQKLEVGVSVIGLLVVNPKNGDNNTTPWQCISIREMADKPEVDAAQQSTPDAAVLEFIRDSRGGYLTTKDIAEDLGIEHRTAGNAAQRLFNDGKIARAEVHGRPNQTRATIILWAATPRCFVTE